MGQLTWIFSLCLSPHWTFVYAATLGRSMSGPLPSARLQVDHVREVIACGDPGRLARALCVHAVQTAGGFYDPERTRRILATVDALVTEQAGPRIEAEVVLMRAGVAWMEGRLSDAVHWAAGAASCVAARPAWACPGTRTPAASSCSTCSRASGAGSAARLCTPTLGSATTASWKPAYWSAGGITRELRKGTPSTPAAALRAAEQIWARDDIDPITLQGGIGRARSLLAHGEDDRARAWVEETNRRMTKSLLWRAFFYRDRWAIAHAETLAAWLGSASGSRREPGKVEKQLAGILRRLEETGVAVAVAAVGRVRG